MHLVLDTIKHKIHKDQLNRQTTSSNTTSWSSISGLLFSWNKTRSTPSMWLDREAVLSACKRSRFVSTGIRHSLASPFIVYVSSPAMHSGSVHWGSRDWLVINQAQWGNNVFSHSDQWCNSITQWHSVAARAKQDNKWQRHWVRCVGVGEKALKHITAVTHWSEVNFHLHYLAT